MNNNTNIFIILLVLSMGFVGTAECGVVIKVRAINPLEEEAPVTIHYPLPAGITTEDVIGKRVTRGKGPAAAADFEINFDENEKVYFVDHLITLAPREIVVLEVEAKDIWTVPQKTIDDLRSQAEDLVKARPRGEGAEDVAPDPVAVKLKEEIFRQLDQVVEAQEAGGISRAGVQGHIEAYQKNRETLQQVGMDITMLRNMIAAAQQTQENPQAPSEAGQRETEARGQAAPSDTRNAFGTPASGSAGGSAKSGPAEQKQSVADKLKSLFRWK